MADLFLDKTGLSYLWSKLKQKFAPLTLTGYSKATSASDIAASDTVLEAIGKLEKRIADLEAQLKDKNIIGY